MTVFPALRAALAKRLGPYLPPHPLQAVTGAALSALLVWGLGAAGYVVGTGAYSVWKGTTAWVASMGDAATDVLKSVPRTAESGNGNATAPAGGKNATLAAVTPEAASPEALPGETVPPVDPNKPLKAAERPYPIVRGVKAVREPLSTYELPYGEGSNMGFTDASRQVDYALAQTFLRLGMDLSRLELLQTEPRLYQDTTPPPLTSPDSGKLPHPEPYLFQRLRVHLPGTAPDFITVLDGNLEAWADRAVLEQAKRQGRTLLRVLVAGMPTHEIFLQPAGTVFVPAPQHDDPRLTVVIDDVGENLDALAELLHLDIPITISVLPYTAHAEEAATAAAVAGQEVLLHQPMEPMQSPYVNPGQGALLMNMTPDAMRETMRRNIARVPQAVGVNNHMGSRATKDSAVARLVAEEAASAGLFVLDSLTAPDSVLYREARNAGVTAYKRHFFIDDGSPTRRGILNILREAEQTALRHGRAIVIGHPRPETIAALKEWVHERDSAVSVVPLRYMDSRE